MTIIKIEPYENGAHDNNIIHGVNPSTFPIPDGYAIIPDNMPIPDTFPFVDITVEGDGPPVVTGMTAGVVPPSPPEPEPDPSEIEVLRAEVASLSVATSIAFVTLAEAGSIDDATAGEHADMFSPWEPDISYGIGNIRRYDDQLYKCIQAHTSQADWTPDTAVSLWTKIADPADEWPEWSQPVGAHDAYNAGDKVSHNGEHWISTVDGNVWTPGVYGWELVKEGGKP